MKKCLLGILVVILFVISHNLPAAEMFSPLTKKDWILESTYMVFHAIDHNQTLQIADSCYGEDKRHTEKNLILGVCPSGNEVNRYFIATALLHAAVSYALPADARTVWQSVTIGVQANQVYRNYNVGLKIKF